MKKIYAFCNGWSYGFYRVLALSEDWDVVWSHICSCWQFFKNDIWITSDRHHKDYDEKLWVWNRSIERVKDDDIKEHKELQEALIKANNKLQEVKPHVEITLS